MPSSRKLVGLAGGEAQALYYDANDGLSKRLRVNPPEFTPVEALTRSGDVHMRQEEAI